MLNDNHADNRAHTLNIWFSNSYIITNMYTITLLIVIVYSQLHS